MEEIYSIVGITKLNIETPETHIIKCETLYEAKGFQQTEIIVIKRKLASRRATGSSFIYPNVFSYKVIDRNDLPASLSYGKNKVHGYIFETLRSGYNDHEGFGEISVIDANGISKSITIGASYHDSAIFIIKILDFIKSFEEIYNSNWNFYDLVLNKDEQIKVLEREINNHKIEIIGLNSELNKFNS